MRSALNAYILETNAPRDRIAAALTIATTTLSLYLRGKYSGDVGKIDAKVADYLKLSKERQIVLKAQPKIKFVMTKGAAMAFGVLRNCHLNGDMGKIIAAPGRGKTLACEEYARQNKGILLITPLQTCNMKTLLKSLVDITGIKTGENNDIRARGLIQIFKKSGRMIIVDEAHFLTTKCLEILRQIHDASGIGLVYAGNDMLRDKMYRPDMEQISSRIGISTTLPDLSENDYHLIIAGTGLKVTGAGLKKASEIAHGSGRVLAKNLPHAHRLANGCDLTDNHFLAADKLREIA